MSEKEVNFEGMSRVDVVALVVSTAVTAKRSGYPVQVNKTKVGSREGLIIWIPGFTIEDGKILPLKEMKTIE